MQPISEVHLIDCMEFMRDKPDKFWDLAIVDPPYQGNDAIGMTDCKRVSAQATKRTNYKLFENVAPDKKYFEELKRVSKNQIIWGGQLLRIVGGRGSME